MANRRQLKKQINGLLGDVIEEHYNALLNNNGKNEERIEALVDECADLADELIAKVNGSKKIKSRTEIKKQFSEIKEKLGDNLNSFIEKLDSV
jgi:TPP-dependent pyruvate/acetoin dehydrogenase alpha subunit